LEILSGKEGTSETDVGESPAQSSNSIYTPRKKKLEKA
jgi:hypothetical protein